MTWMICILAHQGKDEALQESKLSHLIAGGSQELQLTIWLLPRFHLALQQ
jgi:hypothetical protein